MFELALIASVCEDNPNIKDLILAVYTHSLSLAVIREYDTKRAQKIFRAYCEGWTPTDYVLAENVASGIEFAMFMTENAEAVTFEQRVTTSLNAIMMLYEVPEDTRKRLLAEVMEKDYRSKGRKVTPYFCPADANPKMNSYTLNSTNNVLAKSLWAGLDFSPVSKAKYPSKLCHVIDGKGNRNNATDNVGLYTYSYLYAQGATGDVLARQASRHSKAANVLYADLHVAPIRQQELAGYCQNYYGSKFYQHRSSRDFNN